MTDKKTGRTYHGLNRFVDGGDCGDEYNFCPPPMDSRQDLPTLKKVNIARGAVQQVMTVSLVLAIPQKLSADRKSRSAEMAGVSITTIITLTQHVPRVDIHTQIANCAQDHRLRVHFPVPAQKVEAAVYDGHFEIVKRKIGIPQFDSAWVEEPRPETHQRAFTAVGDDQVALTIANRGLPEVAVTGTSRPEIALTLLRCVGWLSRDDLSTRKGHAGPFLETPGAQMPGEWQFDYAIMAGFSAQHAWCFESPLRAIATEIHAGELAASGSFISVDHPAFVVSAVKESEDDQGLIVRGYNISDEEIPVTIAPWHRFCHVERVNMDEKMIARLEAGAPIKVRRHEVVTVKFDRASRP